MKLVGKRKRTREPARNARVLVIEPDTTELDTVSALLRAAGFRVVALSRPDALAPLCRAFKPEVVVIGLGTPELDALRTGRRLSRRFRGAVPVLYLAAPDNAPVRALCVDAGGGIDVIARADGAELVRKIRTLVGFKAAISDAERASYHEKSPSMHDEVTGLYNRRLLLEMVSAEQKRGERYGGTFSVVIAELDDFMEFHERFGEEACDRLMVYGALLLKQGLRDADVLARVGRFHFGVLLPSMGAEDLSKLTERFERRFGLARFQLEGKSVRASMTFGAATFPDVVGPAQQIFAKAIQDLDRVREERKGDGAPRAAV